jgi:cell division protein FtsW
LSASPGLDPWPVEHVSVRATRAGRAPGLERSTDLESGAHERRAEEREQRAARPARPYINLRDAAPASFHTVWVTAVLLLTAGMCTVLSVSVAQTVTGGDKYEWVRPQGIMALVGLALLVAVSFVNYQKLRKFSLVFLAFTMFSLIAIHIPGVSESEGGASSWIPLGLVTFQPSEFAKLAVILAGAHLLSSPRVKHGTFASYLLPFGVGGLAVCGLVMAENDLGTSIIIVGLLLGLLWLAGMKAWQWLAVTGVGVSAALAIILTSEERMSRITVLFDPAADPTGEGWQLWQSLVALGRGGWFGTGPGGSVQKYAYLPEAHNDMIFAIFGEEFGFLGAGFLIVLFGLFALACWRLARRCADPMGKYLIAGCGMLVTLQAVINIGGVTGAIPLTGVPLPFVSYGRNSLIVMLLAVGLILAVARRAPARATPPPAVRCENVARIDRRRWHRGSRRARPGAC